MLAAHESLPEVASEELPQAQPPHNLLHLRRGGLQFRRQGYRSVRVLQAVAGQGADYRGRLVAEVAGGGYLLDAGEAGGAGGLAEDALFRG